MVQPVSAEVERKRRSSTLSGESSASSAAQTTIIANPVFKYNNHEDKGLRTQAYRLENLSEQRSPAGATGRDVSERRRTSPQIGYSMNRGERVRVPVAPRSLARTFSSDSSSQRARQALPSLSGGGPPPYSFLYGPSRSSPPPPPPGTMTSMSPRVLGDFEKIQLVSPPRANSSQSSPSSGSSTARKDETTPRVNSDNHGTSPAAMLGSQKPDLVCNLPAKSSPAGSTSSAVSAGGAEPFGAASVHTFPAKK
ncbi:hypothetical protein AAVH_41646 [Aphelenchoides avenae]|nr:hypothetical protein AAVH_41646 [Aphelenchus avenae]